METLLPGEEVAVYSDDRKVLLTNMRIVIQKKFANSFVFLEEVNSIEVSRYGDIYYLFLSVIFVFMFEQHLLPTESNSLLMVAQAISSAVLIILWWIFHRAVVIVALKNGKKEKILISRSAFGEISGFVNAIQAERDKRLKSLISDKRSL